MQADTLAQPVDGFTQLLQHLAVLDAIILDESIIVVDETVVEVSHIAIEVTVAVAGGIEVAYDNLVGIGTEPLLQRVGAGFQNAEEESPLLPLQLGDGLSLGQRERTHIDVRHRNRIQQHLAVVRHLIALGKVQSEPDSGSVKTAQHTAVHPLLKRTWELPSLKTVALHRLVRDIEQRSPRHAQQTFLPVLHQREEQPRSLLGIKRLSHLDVLHLQHGGKVQFLVVNAAIDVSRHDAVSPFDVERHPLQAIHLCPRSDAHPQPVRLRHFDPCGSLLAPQSVGREQIESLVRQQSRVEDRQVVERRLAQRRFVGKRSIRAYKTDGLVIFPFQAGQQHTHGRSGLHLLARNEVGAEAFHQPLADAIYIVIYLLGLRHQRDHHHLGHRVEFREVDGPHRQLSQRRHRFVDTLFKFYIHIKRMVAWLSYAESYPSATMHRTPRLRSVVPLGYYRLWRTVGSTRKTTFL